MYSKNSFVIQRGCAHRDRILGEYICDTSWLTEEVLNPLAVGQYVNNQNKGRVQFDLFLFIQNCNIAPIFIDPSKECSYYHFLGFC